MARSALESKHNSPDELLGELFHDVQLKRIYPDEMTFVDLIPARRLKEILKQYKENRHDSDFDLEKFVRKHFKDFMMDAGTYVTHPDHTIEEHIDALWSVLRRTSTKSVGSLIGLPKPYIVAGGRFSAQFYWDSYFTMLGLGASKRWDMVENMVKNNAYLIRKLGFVPNGNRTYFSTRSQPPFFAMMVRLLAAKNGRITLVRYLPAMLGEYKFWMTGCDVMNNSKRMAYRRVVRMPDGEILNRYYDDKSTPRPEGYKEDVVTAMAAPDRPPSKTYLDLRAGAETGWDFSSRWLANYKDLETIHTTNIVPVDLNCMLLLLEETIARAYAILRQTKRAARYTQLAKTRADAINKYCWDEKKRFYYDFNIVEGKRTPVVSAAGIFPLFARVASEAQAKDVAAFVRQHLLKKGGLLTTTLTTGQQWDAPNGWAPLQWIAVKGFRFYGRNELADTIKRRWIETVNRIFREQGKLVEKYNVVDPSQSAGGGEYLLQDGFGWTNGVMLALLHEDELHWD